MQRSFDPEFSLLQSEESFSSDINASDHSMRTAPILTGDVAEHLGPDLSPQRAVYGRIITQVIDGEEHKSNIPKLYINTNAPFSTVVCGLQVGYNLIIVSYHYWRLIKSPPYLGIWEKPLHVGAYGKLSYQRRPDRNVASASQCSPVKLSINFIFTCIGADHWL